MYLSNVARSEGDPKVLETGPSSLPAADITARKLGWFSIGIGLTELIAARSITRFLGMPHMEPVVRAYGAREIAQGMISLSPDKEVGLWSRVAGDGLDIATLLPGLSDSNPKRANVALSLIMLAGIAFVDVAAAQAVTVTHRRKGGPRRSYRDRSGYPNGLAAARAVAKNSQPSALPLAAQAS